MMGHKYSLAHTGPHALEIAPALQPDVILLDIGLPGMSGYDVCRNMRSNPLFEHTLIVAQTGWGQERDREMAREAGFDHHLVKPLKLDDIMALFATVTS
jgi:CheY-like chemotaxis protein